MRNSELSRNKLKVLMIDTSPMLYDGITTVILNYISNMDKSDVQIDVLAINNPEESLKKLITSTGIHLYILESRNTNQVKYLKELISLIKNNRYTVVHAHGNSCTLAIEMLAAKLGGAKVRCPHSHNTKCAHNRAHKLLRPLFNMCYTNGFACGYEAGKWLYRDHDFTVLKNGIDTEKYRFSQKDREEFRRKLGLADKIAVGHVAHFTPHKNHEFLLDVFKKVIDRNNKYVLVLVGDGRYRERIENQIRSLGIQDNVVLTGVTTDVPQILSAMDFMVLPSLYEGMPCVVIEWQASGLSAILADSITTECKMSDLISYVPLEQEKWVEAILECNYSIDRNHSAEAAIKSIRDAGYDIVSQANVLKDYYFKYSG